MDQHVGLSIRIPVPPRLLKALMRNLGAHEWHWVGGFQTNTLGSGTLFLKPCLDKTGAPSVPMEEKELEHLELDPGIKDI